MRIGILTSGGDAPGMNALIAGAAHAAAAAGAQLVGVQGGFAGLAERRVTVVDPLEALATAHEAGTWLGTSRWERLRRPDGVAACADAAARLGLDGVIVCGGNGSTEGARKLAAAGLSVAAVPATIDNDVAWTGTTIGFDSAVNAGVEAIDRLRPSSRAFPDRGFLVQCLGGTSGAIAAGMGAAAAIDLVLAPADGRPLEAIAAALRDEWHRGFPVGIVAEGHGDVVALAARLEPLVPIGLRPTILGYGQRGAPPSALDRVLGRRAGMVAVDAVLDNRSVLVALDDPATIRPQTIDGD